MGRKQSKWPGKRALPRLMAQAETLFDRDQKAALQLLESISQAKNPAKFRIQALAMKAIYHASLGSDSGYKKSEQEIAAANDLASHSRIARARLAHARGYLAYRRGEEDIVLECLNNAAALYPASHPGRAQVFDTLGMVFAYRGDLDWARDYYLFSIKLKRDQGAGKNRFGLALSYGNLGRIELWQEHFAEAEYWFREDLKLIGKDPGMSRTEAVVRNHLALALMGLGKYDEAEKELELALNCAAPDSSAYCYVLKDLAQLSSAKRQIPRAEAKLMAAQILAEKNSFAEVMVNIRHLQGLLASLRSRNWKDNSCLSALDSFNFAYEGFTRLNMPRECCEVALAKADLQARLGRPEEALGTLMENALPVAERSLFRQLQPLARIEARIEALNPEKLNMIRIRRMLGGISWEKFNQRLQGLRNRCTVWTCDIRGFTKYCDEAEQPHQVVEMLNRLLGSLAQLILDHGGKIDKYVGDSILAFFERPFSAAGVALQALRVVQKLNTECEHLNRPRTHIGVALATGEVMEGNVGCAGKLEHTIIGTPVNKACRLVAKAGGGEILIDDKTREALGNNFRFAPARARQIYLKGIGRVRCFKLLGRAGKQ